MFYSDKHDLFILDNPGTRTAALVRYYAAYRVDGVPAFAPFSSVAERLRGVALERVLLVVADPIQRAVHALRDRHRMSDTYTGESDRFPTDTELVENTSDAAFIEAAPPQKKFYRKGITVIAEHDLADYANATQAGGWMHVENAPPFRAVELTAALRERVGRIYAGDYAAFKLLRVWSGKPTEVRLLTGTCAACAKKQST